MTRLWEDKEINIIESFRRHVLAAYRPLCLLPNAAETQKILTPIIDDEIWKNEWVDSSSKSDPPPDFYSESQTLMMEVMRIDDHAFEEDGRIKNPTNQRARMRGMELRKLLNLHPDTPVLINSPTDLPSSEDHNYRYYTEYFPDLHTVHILSPTLYFIITLYCRLYHTCPIQTRCEKNG